MSSRASGGTLAASLITAAIIGFAGGAYVGTQSGGADAAENPEETTAATTPGSESPDDRPTESPTQTPEETGLSLALDNPEVTEVSPGDCVDLSGALTPPAAEVSIRLQRSVDGGTWENFPDIKPWTTDENGAFGGYACSQREGVNALRVVRDGDSMVSKPVKVTIRP